MPSKNIFEIVEQKIYFIKYFAKLNLPNDKNKIIILMFLFFLDKFKLVCIQFILY